MAITPPRKKVLAVVLAGGEGKRLMPLTADRAKPAVPFGGIYRLIDFALSNVVNSGYLKVVVLTQYKSHSLDRHVTTTWRMSNLLGNYVTPVPAQQRVGKRWYLGSADAIYQSLNLLTDEQPDIVVVVGADHVYRMDFSQMVADHVESGAGCTVAAIRQPIGLADQFGVIDVDPGEPPEDPRVPREADRPGGPAGLARRGAGEHGQLRLHRRRPARRGHPRRRASSGSKHDMGGDIVPWFVDKSESSVYDYKDNEVPGATDRDRGYWRDVGTMRSYYEAHKDLVSPLPVFNLYNNAWPIYTSYGPHPPAKLVEGASGGGRLDVQLDPLARRRRHRRHGQPVGALARGVGQGRRRGVGLGADGRRVDRRGRRRAQRDHRQGRRRPAGRADRRRPRRRPRARVRRRGRPHRAGQAAAGPGGLESASRLPTRKARSTSLRHAATAWSYAARAASTSPDRASSSARTAAGRWLSGISRPSSASSPAAVPLVLGHRDGPRQPRGR